MNYLSTVPRSSLEKLIADLFQGCTSLSNDKTLPYLLSGMLESKDYKGLVDFDFRPYYTSLSPDDAFYARQMAALFSKRVDLPLRIDRKKVAYEKFLECERKCLFTNYRLTKGVPAESRVNSVIYATQRKIARILGDVPELDTLDFSFGPGATTNVKKREANPRIKLSRSLECSNTMRPILEELLNLFPNWCCDFHEKLIETVPGKLSFVPKNAKTERTIVTEPILNGMFQRAIGRYIRRRLRKAGLDLSTQANNQYKAFLGSLLGDLCTVDLSSASDTIAYCVVSLLLPLPWFEFLEFGRSASITYKGKLHVLQKFSSMGNGYTFELETMIFWCLAQSVCEVMDIPAKDVLSYGDDIIIPREAYTLLVEVFDYLGFSVNREKTYGADDIPFRESCGCDYLRGYDIRPFYFREKVKVRHLFLLHNFFKKSGENLLSEIVLKYIPEHVRLWGPVGYGDGHLIGSYHLRVNRKLRRDGFDGGFFDTYKLRALKHVAEEPGDWLYPAYSIYVSHLNDDEPNGESNEAPWDSDDSPSSWDSLPGTQGFCKHSIYTLARNIYS